MPEPEKDHSHYFQHQKIDPALLAWVLSQTTKEEVLQGLRDIWEAGGKELAEFIDELEAASPHE